MLLDKPVWRISEDERLFLLENDMEMLDEAELEEPLVLEPLELELFSSSSALYKGNKCCKDTSTPLLNKAGFRWELAVPL